MASPSRSVPVKSSAPAALRGPAVSAQRPIARAEMAEPSSSGARPPSRIMNPRMLE